MSSVFEVLATIFVLLPGFGVVWIIHATRANRELGTFEFTLVSLANSLLVAGAFLLLGWITQATTRGEYAFVASLRDFANRESGYLAVLLARDGLSALFLYVFAFVAVTFVTFTFSWSRMVFTALSSLGFVRFTRHLTPWEDFMEANRLNWVAADMKDGRTIVGRIAAFSHYPFDRQVILSSTSKYPLRIYDENHKVVQHAQNVRVGQVLVSDDQVTSFQGIEGQHKPVPPATHDYLVLLMLSLLVVTTLLLAARFVAVAVVFSRAQVWAIVVTAVSGILIVGSFRFLTRFP